MELLEESYLRSTYLRLKNSKMPNLKSIVSLFILIKKGVEIYPRLNGFKACFCEQKKVFVKEFLFDINKKWKINTIS